MINPFLLDDDHVTVHFLVKLKSRLYPKAAKRKRIQKKWVNKSRRDAETTHVLMIDSLPDPSYVKIPWEQYARQSIAAADAMREISQMVRDSFPKGTITEFQDSILIEVKKED